MATTITNIFDTKFRSQVKVDFQRRGPLLKQACTIDDTVNANVLTIKKLGTGVATTKSRHGIVPTMDAAHSTVTATMQDYYAAEYEDDLDRLKHNATMFSRYSENIAAALGRRYDETILTALSATTTEIAVGGTPTGLTFAKLLEAERTLNERDVPFSDRYLVIGPEQWQDLKSIDGTSANDWFASADYNNNKPLAGGPQQSFMWGGWNIIMHSGLSIASSVRDCYAFHKSSIGVGQNKDITIRSSFLDDRDTHQIMGKMSLGAVIIDQDGVIEIKCQED
jgi:hypothetical protein